MVLARAWIEAKQAAVETKPVTEPVSSGASIAEAAGEAKVSPEVPASIPIVSPGLVNLESFQETWKKWINSPLTWPVGVARMTPGGVIVL
jgi:hypothetical protein